jgi:hypothetical protein
MNQPNALPDTQTAYDNLFLGVRQEVFFQKCASNGYVPRTAEEAQWMMDTALQLRDAEADPQFKQASDQSSPYYQANQYLRQVLGRYGVGTKQAAAQAHAEEALFQRNAAQLAADPTFYNSVLSLKAAEAQQLKASYDQWQAQQRAQGAA